MLELRVDLFKRLEAAYVLAQIKKRKALKVPLLLTLRSQKREGAVKEISEAIKLRIMTAAMPRVDMVDIELGSPLLKEVVLMARRQGKKVIVSSHDLNGMPRDLESILKKSLSAGADLVKIAGRAASFNDVLDMLTFTHAHRKHGLITMCLGKAGAVSRLVLPAAGSRYTYTFLEKPTAEGQVDVLTLKSHLKVYYP